MILVIISIIVLLIASGLHYKIRKNDQSQATQRNFQHKASREKKRAPNRQTLGQSPLEPTFNIRDIEGEGDGASDSEFAVQKTAPVQALNHVALHVMASGHSPYTGYELLQALLANGLRFGSMNIFHRHENKNGSGRVLFSVASVNQPGTFELSKMGEFSCPGLTLFFSVKAIDNPVVVFELMLETAKQLCEDLGGEIWDADRNPLQEESLRQQLRGQDVLDKETAFSEV